MRSRRRLAAALSLLALQPAIALAFYLAGNGVTRSALALASVPLALVTAAVWASGRALRSAPAVLAALLALDGVYVADRCVRTETGRSGIRLCEMRDCTSEAPLLTRLAPESETARAGMALTSTLGMIREPERSELTRLLRHEYDAIDRSPALSSLPSAPLLGLVRGRGRHLLWLPPDTARPAPAIVFLHGFGGQLTAYLTALLDAGLGEHHAILAPFGGPVGMWWSDSEQERLLDLLDHGLPPSVDPSRLTLVGLSNGAIGATAIAASPRFAGRFRRVVALSGARLLDAVPATTAPILFLTGRDDPRFPFEYIEQAHARMRDRGVTTSLAALPGDHFIILSKISQDALTP